MLKAYENYQEVELPWLEQVPAHWQFLRNKNIFIEKKDIIGNSKELKLLSLTKKGVIVRDISTGKGKFPKDFESYKIVEDGDIVFCLFDVDETPRTVGLSNHRGMITGAYKVFCIRNVNSEFIQYYYIAFDNIKAFKPLYTGLRKVIQLSTFMSTKVIVPPKLEQEQIVLYLNWKVFAMDYFINQKKRQIQYLVELKQKTVSDAVTKGLHNGVEMKETGINWLPYIPATWKVVSLRQLLQNVSVKNHPEMQLLSVTRDLGVIMRDINDFESNHNYIPDDLSGYKVVKVGQFVINKMKAWQGSYGVSKYEGIVSPAYYVMNVEFSNTEFFHLAIRSKAYINLFAQYSDGIRVGQWDLSMQKMKTRVREISIGFGCVY